MAKVGKNDLCPCGSGKKYKHCCLVKEKDRIRNERMKDFLEKISSDGETIEMVNLKGVDIKLPSKEDLLFDYKLSYISESVFAKRRMEEDALFIFFLLSDILYSSNKRFFELEKTVEEKGYNYDEIIRENVKADFYGEIKKVREELSKKPNLKGITRPFDTYSIEENVDAVVLYNEGKISFFQILSFHYYLLEWLSLRFDEYRYIPISSEIEGNLYGLNQHRGFDYILAMAINIEIQLGIHIILDTVFEEKKLYIPSGDELYFPQLEYVIGAVSLGKLQAGSRYLLYSYFQMLEEIKKNYKPKRELMALYKQTTMTEIDCKERLVTLSKDSKQPSGYYYDYISALKCMCVALIHESSARGGLFDHALNLCSQIDYIKTLYAVEALQCLFNKDISEFFITSEEAAIDTYHSAVFYFLDEKNGLAHGLFPDDLEYIDNNRDADPLEQTHSTYYLKNPAINEIYYFDHNHFRLDVYELLEGRFLPLYYKGEIVCSIPMIPFLFNKNLLDIERIQSVNYSSIYDQDIRIRQAIINAFLEVTDIQANEFREYLNPVTFYSWLENNKLRQQLSEMNKTIDQLREKLAEDISSSDEGVRELALTRLQNDTVSSISELGEDIGLQDDKIICQKEIITFLSESVWNKLKNDSKKYLLTSRITFKKMLELDSSDELDYSGVCLLITKAVDVEVFRRFFKAYKKYLKKKYGDDYSKWPRCMLDKYGKQPIAEKMITLGSIIYLMGMDLDDDKKVVVDNESSEYKEFVRFSSEKLFTDASQEEIETMLYQDAVYIEEARNEYRNKTAHRNEMNQSKAKECNDYVIERIKIMRKILEPMKF